MTIFGSSKKDGDFQLIGNIQDSQAKIVLGACYFREIEQGKAVSIYGYCETCQREEFKYKEDESWKEFDPDGQLVRFDLFGEDFTKTYNGNSTTKKATPTGRFVFNEIKAKDIKEGDIFSLEIDFLQNEQTFEAITTGKSSKGRDLSEDVIEELKESIYSLSLEVADEMKAKLEGTKEGEKRRGGGGSRAVTPQEKYAFILKSFGIPDGSDLETAGAFLQTMENASPDSEQQLEQMKWIVAACCQ